MMLMFWKFKLIIILVIIAYFHPIASLKYVLPEAVQVHNKMLLETNTLTKVLKYVLIDDRHI
jgi:hypothetical protein